MTTRPIRDSLTMAQRQALAGAVGVLRGLDAALGNEVLNMSLLDTRVRLMTAFGMEHLAEPGELSQVGTAVATATTLGTEAGKAAASWVFDGNTTDETYRQFLAWHEAGDPLVDQFAPATGWLSGEWADTRTPQSLLAECGAGDEDEEAVLTAYEEAADTAYWQELERVARYQTEDAS